MTNPPDLPDFDQMWDYDQPQATENQFRHVLAETAHAAPEDSDYRLQLLTQIARTQGLQRKFDEAHKTLDQVEAQLTAHPDRLAVARIRYLLERGRVYNSSGDPERAKALFLQALELGEAAREDFYAVDAAHMVAIVETGDARMDWNLKALAMAEKSPLPRAQRWRGSLYNNIGWAYHDLKQYEKALDMFKKALAARKAQGQVRETLIARWCIARCLRSLNRTDEALQILRDLEVSDNDGYVYEELGENLLVKGQKTEAAGYFAMAHRLLSNDSWLVANEPDRLKRIAELAGEAQ